jgi:lactoylglutathione lyase
MRLTPFLLSTLMCVAASAADEPRAQLSNTVLWVADVHKTAEFYRSVFGLKTHVDLTFGKNLWLELDTGATKLSLMSETEAVDLFGDNVRRNHAKQVPQAISLSFRVADAAATYALALSAGATSVRAPAVQPWGASIARVMDPNGVLIAIIGPPAKAK